MTEPAKGVLMNPPPPSLKDAIDANIMQTVGQLKPRSKTAFIAVSQRINGKLTTNLAFVHKPNDEWEIGTYIAKEWGEPISMGGFVKREW